MIKVMVVDDHPVFRYGLTSILAQYPDFQVVGDAASGHEALAKAESLRPQVVVMDVSMPNGGGVETTALLQQRVPETNVLILTISDNEDDLFGALKAGAKGYLLKTTGLEELVSGMRKVAAGEAIISPSMAARLIKEFKEPGRGKTEKDANGLSAREKEVIALVAQGASNKEIASRLFISETTVKAHLRNILEKLHVRNRTQAVAEATAKGWLHRNG